MVTGSGAFKIDILFIAACLAVATLAAVIYLPGLPGDFMFDDIGSIVGNSPITLHDLNSHSLLRAMLSSPGGGLSRPLSLLSFALNAYFSGLSPAAFKLTNILIHLSCGGTLWFVAREILRAYAGLMRRELHEKTIAWLSLAVTALWLVHPLNFTSVLYTVQRETSLAAFFTAAAILSYLVGRRRQLQDKGGRWQIWCLTPLFTVIGMFCKENAALVPVYLVVIEFTLLEFRGKDRSIRQDIVWFYGVFLLAPLFALCGVLMIKPEFFLRGYVGRDFTMYERLLSECRILLDYLRWTIIPDLRKLGLYHDDLPPSRGLLQPSTTLPSVIGIVILLVSAAWFRRRVPLLSFGILWFFAGHLIESTVLPLELAFEHRNYLPIFGIVLGSVGTLYIVVKDKRQTYFANAMIALGIITFAGITTVRSLEWRSELAFAYFESDHHPQSPRALAELGWAYMNSVVTYKDAALIPRAVEAEEKSKELDRGSINQDIGLAYMFASLHDIPNAKLHLEVAAEGAKSVTISATLQSALQSLLLIATPDNRPLFTDISSIFVNTLANHNVWRDDCYLASIWNTFGLFQQYSEVIPGALSAMHKAVILCPQDPQMRINFARMLLVYRDTKDAKEQIDALGELHGIRYSTEWHELEQEWNRQIIEQSQK